MSGQTKIEDVSAEDIDDFDFPLPNAPAPRQDQVQVQPPQVPVPAPSPSVPQGMRTTRTNDTSQFKEWSCIYPIYIDSKRPYKTGERRIPKGKAVEWPMAKDMAEAANKLGFRVFYEPDKQHPRDWDNPGRIKVLMQADGKPMHPVIQDKKSFLLKLAEIMPNTQKLPWEERLPSESPALSFGFLESAIANGGMPAGMGLPGMPGMPGLPGMPQPSADGSSGNTVGKKGKKQR